MKDMSETLNNLADPLLIRQICESLNIDDQTGALMVFIYTFTREVEHSEAAFGSAQFINPILKFIGKPLEEIEAFVHLLDKHGSTTVNGKISRDMDNLLKMYLYPDFRREMWLLFTGSVLPAFQARKSSSN